jgi:hypothetical protein
MGVRLLGHCVEDEKLVMRTVSPSNPSLRFFLLLFPLPFTC